MWEQSAISAMVGVSPRQDAGSGKKCLSDSKHKRRRRLCAGQTMNCDVQVNRSCRGRTGIERPRCGAPGLRDGRQCLAEKDIA